MTADTTIVGTISTPLRWDGQTLYAGSIVVGWIMPVAGAQPSWLGLQIGCRQVYCGASDEAARAAVLRALIAQGWTLVPPPSEATPEPKAGQVWRAPSTKIEPRTIVSVGPGRGWDQDTECVYFTTPTRQPHERWGPTRISTYGWKRWARKSGARPAPLVAGDQK